MSDAEDLRAGTSALTLALAASQRITAELAGGGISVDPEKVEVVVTAADLQRVVYSWGSLAQRVDELESRSESIPQFLSPSRARVRSITEDLTARLNGQAPFDRPPIAADDLRALLEVAEYALEKGLIR